MFWETSTRDGPAPREEERAGNGGKDYVFLIEFGRYIVVVVVESDEYAS